MCVKYLCMCDVCVCMYVCLYVCMCMCVCVCVCVPYIILLVRTNRLLLLVACRSFVCTCVFVCECLSMRDGGGGVNVCCA